jgi:hypothetical protein
MDRGVVRHSSEAKSMGQRFEIVVGATNRQAYGRRSKAAPVTPRPARPDTCGSLLAMTTKMPSDIAISRCWFEKLSSS